VLDPTFVSDKRTSCFSRFLIDGGSSINLVYRDTIEKLGIVESQLQKSHTTFHDIVPSHSCPPIGKIRLDVMFGTTENFRREPIWFEVVDIQSPYHAQLGCPALTKFMAIPKGIITISGCYKRCIECASADSKLAESLVIVEEKKHILREVTAAQAEVPAPRQPAGETAFQPSKDNKKIALDAAHPDRFITVGAVLSDK
jgi:hypothetical protein